MQNFVSIVVAVPKKYANLLRQVMGDAGGGETEKYSHCSFSYSGIGRFTPKKGAVPAIGEIGKLEIVEEERIEMFCHKDKMKKVIEEMKKVHPYEEPAYYIYPLIDENEI